MEFTGTMFIAFLNELIKLSEDSRAIFESIDRDAKERKVKEKNEWDKMRANVKQKTNECFG